MKVISILLVILALLIFVGAIIISENTNQKSIGIMSACFFLILSRIAQASGHQNELKEILKK